ncbi:MAG TPA: hypothetical protein VHX44_07505 [Planctomycetota bacterium]|jgi:hypothetical protein|nr:hypothetical protein [Planctomycetota bacterium]
MSQRAVPAQAIFVERDGWVYYVTNWQKRFSEPVRPKLVRLSPRHFVRYNELKEKGRSQKTIALLLFKRVAVKVTVGPQQGARESKASDTRTVSVDITMLTHEQILSLLQRTLNERLPGLRALPLPELRRLYLAVQDLTHGQ